MARQKQKTPSQDGITIERGIPIPPDARGRLSGRDTVEYPFDLMLVGDSFLRPVSDMSRLRSAATAFAKRAGGIKFTSRMIGSRHVRIWRVA